MAVVLAAGAGERLRPLTRLRPKPLCPVGNVTLLDGALTRAAAVVAPGAVAVNVHHHRALMEEHLAGRADVHVSVEPGEARGTAGALGLLRDWIAGRAALVVNGDSWSAGTLVPLLAGWDGRRVRILVHGRPVLAAGSPVVASLLPWSAVRELDERPAGLYEVCWRPAQVAGELEVVGDEAPFVDCGTPASYLRANRLAAAAAGGGGHASIVDPGAVVAPGAVVEGSVVGAGAVVQGALHGSVVWPGAAVPAGERLDRAIRADGITVLVR